MKSGCPEPVLRPSTVADVRVLQGWFPSPESAHRWGGPGLRHPFTPDRFLADIRWGEVASWSLVDAAGAVLGFGQYYPNHGRCHLARIAVVPDRRGCGLGRTLVRALIRAGLRDLDVEECSLFVLNDNQAAIRCYLALGFVPRGFPDWQTPFGDATFMVRPAG